MGFVRTGSYPLIRRAVNVMAVERNYDQFPASPENKRFNLMASASPRATSFSGLSRMAWAESSMAWSHFSSRS